MEETGGVIAMKTGSAKKRSGKGEYFVLTPKDYVGIKIEEKHITFSIGRNDAPTRKDNDESLSLVLAQFIDVVERKFPYRRDYLIKAVNEIREATASGPYPKTQKEISDFLSRVNND